MNVRIGDYLTTFSGKQFWPLDPRPEDIDPVDIAHSLSMQCRYAGHCQKFYSVAEHCVHLSNLVKPENALWALLHDASEAYLIDVPRPIKRYLNGYVELEAEVMKAICHYFELEIEMPLEVKNADFRILSDEGVQNMGAVHPNWADPSNAFGFQLAYWAPNEARYHFLMRLRELWPLWWERGGF